MAKKANLWKIIQLPVALAAFAVVVPAPAVADPDLPYGPDTCIQGLVWREARSGDTVCVTPEFRARTATENANVGANKDPLAGSGPESCSQGYVWREAFDGDTICVTPAIRQANWDANTAAESNYQRNQAGSQADTVEVTFEVYGVGGEAMSITTDPPSDPAPDHTPFPWVRTMTVPADTPIYQVVVVVRSGFPGCRIVVDNKVVVDQGQSKAPHCVYTP